MTDETQSIDALALLGGAAMTRAPGDETRAEACDRLGLDPEELHDYALMTFNDHAVRYAREGRPPTFAILDVLLAGILLGLEMER